MVTRIQLLSLILTAIIGIGIPSLVLIVRASRRLAQLEDKIDMLVAKEIETKQEVASKFAAIERELVWMRDKIWTLWNRWGGQRK